MPQGARQPAKHKKGRSRVASDVGGQCQCENQAKNTREPLGEQTQYKPTLEHNIELARPRILNMCLPLMWPMQPSAALQPTTTIKAETSEPTRDKASDIRPAEGDAHTPSQPKGGKNPTSPSNDDARRDGATDNELRVGTQFRLRSQMERVAVWQIQDQ